MENESKDLPIQQLTNSQISKIKNEEIMNRLKHDEEQKARALLATAMSQLEAYRIVKNLNVKKMNGHGKIK